MHGDDFLKGPGQSSKHSSSHGKKEEPSSADKSLMHGKKGGGGGGVHAAAQKKKEEEDAYWEAQEKKRMEQANTDRPAPPVDRTVVKITNIQWDRESVTTGGKAFVSMDIDIPPNHAHVTGVTCAVEQLMQGGEWKKTESTSNHCDAKDGKAHCEIAVPPPLNNPDGTTPTKIKYRVEAKHAYSKETLGPPVDAVPGDPASRFDSVVYYIPTRNQYVVYSNLEEYNTLVPEIEKMNGLKGKTKQMLEATDPAVRKQLGEEIDEEAKELFEAQIVGETEPVIEALINIRKPRKWANPPGYVYVRPHALNSGSGHKGKLYKDTDEAIKDNIKDLLEKAPGSKEHSPFFSTEVKCSLFKGDPLTGQWPIKWNFKVEKDGEFLGRGYTFSSEAVVCQYALGFDGIEGSGNWKERKFHLGTGGHISYDLFNGKAEGSFPLPENGVNLLTLLKTSPYLDSVLAKDRKCLLRLNVTLKGDAFVGVSVTGALNLLDLDLSKETLSTGGPKAGSGAEVHGFAGAKVGGGLVVGVEWGAPDLGHKFKALGTCGTDIEGSAGASAEFEWKVEYKDGVFYFHGGAGLTVALGCKGKFTFELGLVEGVHFIGYLCSCLDYHKMDGADKSTFSAYKNIAFTMMALANLPLTTEEAMANKVITNFPRWLKDIKKEYAKVKETLTESSYRTGALNNVPPEALGQALLTIMKFREQADFRSIMQILCTTTRRNANVGTDPSANHKLKWTLRSVWSMAQENEPSLETDLEREDALKKGIKKIMDFGFGIGYVDKHGNPQDQNDVFLHEFQNLLKKYGVI